MFAKLFTALRLLVTGEIAMFRRQARFFCRAQRLKRARAPFVFRRHGIRYAVLPQVPASRRQFLEDDDNEIELRVWHRWLAPGDAAIDAGAHTGSFAFCAAAAVGPSGRVLAIDGDAAAVENLRRSAQLLGCSQVTGVHAAVGDSVREADFYIAGGVDVPDVEQSLVAVDDRYRAVRIQMSTLAKLADPSPGAISPTAIKLDLEGAEALALSAAPATWFAADGPLWVVELNPSALARFHATPEAVLRYFDSAAFQMWLVPHYPRLDALRATRRYVPGAPLDDALFHNLIAVPRSTRLSDRRARIAAMLT